MAMPASRVADPCKLELRFVRVSLRGNKALLQWWKAIFHHIESDERTWDWSFRNVGVSARLLRW